VYITRLENATYKLVTILNCDILKTILKWDKEERREERRKKKS
jgi:hypothetical protein